MEKLKLLKQKFAGKQAKDITKLISLVLVTVILLGVAAWAWFATQEKADASGLSISLGASKNLEMSLDGGATWHFGIDLLSADTQQYISEGNRVKDKLNMLDITSDGKTFLRPVFTQTDNVRIPDCTQVWSTPNKNSAYISQNVCFRTNFAGEIYMGAGTEIITSCEKTNNDLVGISPGNKSTYGNFSTDCIVGALRISAVDSSDNLCFTMIPRNDVELVKNGDNYSVLTGINVSDNTSKHTYFASDYLTTQTTTTKADVLTGFSATPENNPKDSTWIADTVYNPDTGYFEGQATINIWLEGCDAETLRALSGGKFNINLEFVAFESEEAANENTQGQ